MAKKLSDDNKSICNKCNKELFECKCVERQADGSWIEKKLSKDEVLKEFEKEFIVNVESACSYCKGCKDVIKNWLSSVLDQYKPENKHELERLNKLNPIVEILIYLIFASLFSWFIIGITKSTLQTYKEKQIDPIERLSKLGYSKGDIKAFVRETKWHPWEIEESQAIRKKLDKFCNE